MQSKRRSEVVMILIMVVLEYVTPLLVYVQGKRRFEVVMISFLVVLEYVTWLLKMFGIGSV